MNSAFVSNDKFDNMDFQRSGLREFVYDFRNGDENGQNMSDIELMNSEELASHVSQKSTQFLHPLQ